FELGVPVVIALNMIDVAKKQGVRIDAERLARQLGVPVVPIQANRGKGIEALKQAIARAVETEPPPLDVGFPEAFQTEVELLRSKFRDGLPAYLARRLLLDA